MGKGNFFAIGKRQFASACELGLNSAVLFLVMACGTCKNNRTTSWSAKAANTYAGLAWRKAKAAIEILQEHALIEKICCGKRPRYNLAKPIDFHQLIWLPNSLIVPAKGSDATPISKLRQTQNIGLLKFFVELYSVQKLESRSHLIRVPGPTAFKRTPIRDLGQYILFGFKEISSSGSIYFSDMNLVTGVSDENIFYGSLELMGLIQRGVYLAEADTANSNLIHPIVDNQMTNTLIDVLTSFDQDGYDYAIPIRKEILDATLVYAWQLAHQPETSLTSAEYEIHRENCEKHAANYRNIHSTFFSSDPVQISLDLGL